MVTLADYAPAVPTIRLFASAREAAGTGRAQLDGSTVGEVLGEARRRYGEPDAARALGHE